MQIRLIYLQVSVELRDVVAGQNVCDVLRREGDTRFPESKYIACDWPVLMLCKQDLKLKWSKAHYSPAKSKNRCLLN